MAIGPANYNYDALDRLTQEQTATRRKTYAYDATGNRKTRYGYTTTNGVEVQSSTQLLYYASDSNRLTSDANIPVVMDATGNSLQRSPSRVHNYDEQGRLSQVLNPTALYADFAYNALGQRTIKRAYLGTVLDFTVTQLYGQDGQLLGLVRYNNLGKISWAQYWIWLDGMPLAQLELRYNTNGAVTSTNLYYLHSDHLNTPRLATNQAQTLLWKWDSDAFGLGNPIGDVDGDGVVVDIPLRFPGQIFEAYSNLNYNYFRDYEANTGRYVESDPIGLEGGLNTYGYVSGNPMSYLDQFGLEKLSTTDPKRDHVINNAVRVDPDKPGTLIVYSHGNAAEMYNDRNGRDQREPLDAAKMAKIIKDSDQYKPGMPVVLRSCNTGYGKDPIAQRLADILGVDVSAPDSYYYFNLDGSVGPVHLNWMRRPETRGNMITFKPRR